jgi:hypothetical protein
MGLGINISKNFLEQFSYLFVVILGNSANISYMPNKKLNRLALQRGRYYCIYDYD